MTKNNKSVEAVKASQDLQAMLEQFPSPPKKDGTPDKENILAKQRREAAEKAGYKKSDSSSGEKKKG